MGRSVAATAKKLDAIKIVKVQTPVLPRDGQDYEEYDLTMTGFSKTNIGHDYSGGWYATLHGTQADIFKFFTEVCGLTIADALEHIGVEV